MRSRWPPGPGVAAAVVGPVEVLAGLPRLGRPPRCSSGCRRGTGRCPPAGRSSSNHSKPGVFSTAPARPRKRSSNRSCLSSGTVIALIFTTLMPLPFPAPGRASIPHGHPGGRERAPHRRPRLRPAGPRPGRPHRHARGRLRRREDPGADRGLPRGACCDGGAPLAWATRVDDATAAAVLERWPDARRRRRGPAAPSSGELPEPVGDVLVLTAGTSDGPVAAEVAATLAASGVGCRRVDDVGVAGVHRVLAVAPDLATADAVVVVAGMDGALPERGRRAHRPAGRRGADVGRLRRRVRGARRRC